jgi:hypothetical protein
LPNLWEPVETSGLPDDFDFTVASAEFGYDAAYADGEQIVLILTSTEVRDDGENHREMYSLGKAGAWETLDHGRTVVSQASPPAEGFNKQSKYWKFIEAALATGAPVASRGTPDNASIWEGLTFRMGRITVNYGGDIGEVDMLAPTAFVGKSGKAEAPAPTTTTEAPAPVETGGGGAVTNLLEVQVSVLGKASDTHDAFIESVMEKHPEAMNDEDLFPRILDPNGIYAEVNK